MSVNSQRPFQDVLMLKGVGGDELATYINLSKALYGSWYRESNLPEHTLLCVSLY